MARKVAVKVKEVKEETRYECILCEDRKIVERHGKMQKCICVITKEVKAFLSDFGEQYKVNKTLSIDNINRDLLYYDAVTITNFLSRAKSFMFQKFFRTEENFYCISGTELTEAYVTGDEAYSYYQLIDNLFLKIGYDNFNQTQLTTLINLVISRKEKGLVTWIYIYPNVVKSRLIDLYGSDFVSFIFDDANYKKVRK